jgi:hypothetical protein
VKLCVASFYLLEGEGEFLFVSLVGMRLTLRDDLSSTIDPPS